MRQVPAKVIVRCVFAIALAGLLVAQTANIEEVWTLLREGKRRETIALLRNLVNSNPKDADARMLLGSVLMEGGQRDESIANLTEAVRLRPNSAEAQNALGEAYNAFDDPKSARAPFERAVKMDPKFAAARVNLGAVLIQSGEMDAAAGQLDRALALIGSKPDAAYPLYLRAKIFTEHGETERAVAALNKAVSLQPDFTEAWSDLGDARKKTQDDAGAIAAFEQAVRIRPDDAVAQTRLATELMGQGRAHAAVEHFEAASRLIPMDQSVLNGLQRALRADGQTANADEVKKRLLELLREKDLSDQNSMAAIRLNNEGAALEKSGDLNEAAAKYRTALELDPSHNGIRVNLAVALLRTGEWQEGLADLREALRRDPNNPTIKAALEDALDQAPVEFGGKGKARTRR